MDRYVLYGQTGTALLTGAALDRLGRAGGWSRAVATAAAGAAVVALLPLTLHLRTPQSRTDDVADVARARMLAMPRIVALRDPAGQPVDRIAREAVKRQVLATYFEECATRRVRGARITVFARAGRC